MDKTENNHVQTTTISALLNENTKTYACHQCEQTFSRIHNLKSHLATHSQDRPFQCDTCHQYFRRQHDLKRHQKLHTGERPYVCNKCNRSFARLDALNRHQRIDGGTACNNRHRRSVSTSTTTTKRLSLQQEPITTITHNHPSSTTTTTTTTTITTTSPPPLTSSPIAIEAILLPQPQSQSSPILKHLSLPPLPSLQNPTKTLFDDHHHHQQQQQHHTLYPPTSPYRSWSYPNLGPSLSRILPVPDSLSLQQRIKELETENTALKGERSMDRTRIHDLEVENKLLKSLIVEQQQQSEIPEDLVVKEPMIKMEELPINKKLRIT
ncbi:MAG: hypothetical protein EXX96DRAFT_166681 [Benjaminiella poitrasii]|nr:MAG: hypothetical protein EXX96DRAFT_166681 [Benjaminiella poitrasii]